MRRLELLLTRFRHQLHASALPHTSTGFTLLALVFLFLDFPLVHPIRKMVSEVGPAPLAGLVSKETTYSLVQTG